MRNPAAYLMQFTCAHALIVHKLLPFKAEHHLPSMTGALYNLFNFSCDTSTRALPLSCCAQAALRYLRQRRSPADEDQLGFLHRPHHPRHLLAPSLGWLSHMGSSEVQRRGVFPHETYSRPLLWWAAGSVAYKVSTVPQVSLLSGVYRLEVRHESGESAYGITLGVAKRG